MKSLTEIIWKQYVSPEGKVYQLIARAKDLETGTKNVVLQELAPPYHFVTLRESVFMGSFREDRSGMPAEEPKEEAPEAESAEGNPGTSSDTAASPALDPGIEAFLDAEGNREKLNILASLRNRITDHMIDVMAVSIGVEIRPGDIDQRYEDLRSCLLTIDHYEQSRSRYEDKS